MIPPLAHVPPPIPPVQMVEAQESETDESATDEEEDEMDVDGESSFSISGLMSFFSCSLSLLFTHLLHPFSFLFTLHIFSSSPTLLPTSPHSPPGRPTTPSRAIRSSQPAGAKEAVGRERHPIRARRAVSIAILPFFHPFDPCDLSTAQFFQASNLPVPPGRRCRVGGFSHAARLCVGYWDIGGVFAFAVAVSFACVHQAAMAWWWWCSVPGHEA